MEQVKMLRRVIEILTNKKTRDAQRESWALLIKEQKDTKERILQFEIQDAQGKKIIYCSNEWEDPLFGVVIGVEYVTLAKQPMLVVECALTKRIGFVHPGSYYIADEAMVDCILKLNPFERWNMFARNQSYNMWTKGYPNGPITEPTELKKQLKASGFI